MEAPPRLYAAARALRLGLGELRAAAAERDPAFREEIRAASVRGLLTMGALGVGGLLLYLAGHALGGNADGKALAWSYAGHDPGTVVSVRHHAVALAMSLAAVGLGRTRAGRRHARLLMGVLVVVVGAAWTLDSAERGDVSFIPAWLALLLFSAASLVPFRPWQTAGIAAALAATFGAATLAAPAAPDPNAASDGVSRLVFLVLIGALSVSVSGFLHLHRHRQFRSRQRVERLSAEARRTAALLAAEKETSEAQARRLAELDAAKSRLFANLSHEFRTPLTLILGPLDDAEAGRFGDLPPALRRHHAAMRRSARRLLRLINQLLDLSRIEAGRTTLDARPGDVAAWLRGLVAGFAPLAERRGVRLQFRATTETLPARFDADALEKVVSNLLSNALKFTPPGGKVWVTLADAGAPGAPLVEVVVKDTGPGIAPEDLGRLFERFHQGDAPAARAHEGSGLGLALARELVGLHGGRIAVETEPGYGSAFLVRLPLAPAEEVPAGGWVGGGMDAPGLSLTLEAAGLEPAPPAAPAAAPDGRPTVLVAEDNADVRALLRAHLEPTYRVVEAADGRAALDAARAERPDLVLADVLMPEVDGLALCRALRADAALRHLPVVLLTARADEADAVAGLGCGADDYVTKPFRAGELLARVGGLLESRRTLRSQFSREVVVQPAGIVVQPEEAAFLDRVLAAVEGRLGDEAFNVDALAEEVGLSRRQLERRLHGATGEGPAELVRRLRLERAAGLLRGRGGPVSEVAYAVGFRSPSHFAAAFREAYGVSPSAYAADGAPSAGENAT